MTTPASVALGQRSGSHHLHGVKAVRHAGARLNQRTEPRAIRLYTVAGSRYPTAPVLRGGTLFFLARRAAWQRVRCQPLAQVGDLSPRGFRKPIRFEWIAEFDRGATRFASGDGVCHFFGRLPAGGFIYGGCRGVFYLRVGRFEDANRRAHRVFNPK